MVGGKQELRFQMGTARGVASWMEMEEEEEEEQGSCQPPGLGAGQLSSLAEVEVVEGGRQGQRGRSWKVEEHHSPGTPRSPPALV